MSVKESRAIGRPSRAPERRHQILDAFEAAVGEDGLQGASLESTARRAGLKRQLVLHYFGNRRALVEAAVERILQHYRERVAAKLGGFDDAERLPAFLDWLFLGDFCEPRIDALLAEIHNESRRDPALREALQPAYTELEQVLVEELAKAVPEASLRARRETAFLVLALCFGSGHLLAVTFPRVRREAAYAQALAAVRSLGLEAAP
ncbi:MAG: TetR/AcrR family transcriptional regulator [Proteobacteria bacterium]|nr:TetR/AcrR family transcriptional regulator [Pseudomonadota bacterium]